MLNCWKASISDIPYSLLYDHRNASHWKMKKKTGRRVRRKDTYSREV